MLTSMYTHKYIQFSAAYKVYDENITDLPNIMLIAATNNQLTARR